MQCASAFPPSRAGFSPAETQRTILLIEMLARQIPHYKAVDAPFHHKYIKRNCACAHGNTAVHQDSSGGRSLLSEAVVNRTCVENVSAAVVVYLYDILEQVRGQCVLSYHQDYCCGRLHVIHDRQLLPSY